MANLRFKALETAMNRDVPVVTAPSNKVSDYYGTNVFGMEAMRANLSTDVFKKVNRAITEGSKIDEDTADAVASAMKTWATSKNATHYTHWFQPLTGATAEKHDAFFDVLPNGSAGARRLFVPQRRHPQHV
jgi:glutamine synthetase